MGSQQGDGDGGYESKKIFARTPHPALYAPRDSAVG